MGNTIKPSTAWLSIEITYGLYLSDHSILDGVDTELVVLGGIMMQNLPRETGWHLRGTRRIGVSFEDVETVQQCVSFLPIPSHQAHQSSFRSCLCFRCLIDLVM